MTTFSLKKVWSMSEDGGIFLRPVFSQKIDTEPNAHCCSCKKLNLPNICNALGIEYIVPDIYAHIECDYFLCEVITE